jgi:preprotein translocase subunit SecE
MKQWFEKVKAFLIEVWQELKRTTWPGRREVYGTTLVVIVMVLLCALFLYGVDVVLQPIAQFVYPTTR